MVNIKYKIKRYLERIKLILKQKVQQWLGLATLTKEVHYNFIHINALEEYIKAEKDIEDFVKTQCKKHNITDHENIKQIIKNQEVKNYLDYKDKILTEEEKALLNKLKK